jgi:hypothetical protein
MSEPTTKACLESAALGCAQLLRLARDYDETGDLDDIIDHDEAVKLDTAVWSLMDYAEEQRDGEA